MSSTTYSVTGMSCSHCVRSVRDEVGKIGGVTRVDVDLAAGLVTIDATAPISDAAVLAAVDEAGYEAKAL